MPCSRIFLVGLGNHPSPGDWFPKDLLSFAAAVVAVAAAAAAAMKRPCPSTVTSSKEGCDKLHHTFSPPHPALRMPALAVQFLVPERVGLYV